MLVAVVSWSGFLATKKKKKHEKVLSDSRESITILRTAACGGATGPTTFLMNGAKIKTGYTDQFLRKHGAAPGSSVVMTPSAFMTEDAWLEIAAKRADGIRAMPVIRDHPDHCRAAGGALGSGAK